MTRKKYVWGVLILMFCMTTWAESQSPKEPSPADAYDPYQDPVFYNKLELYDKFSKLMGSEDTLSDKHLQEIDLAIVKVALYRTRDRKAHHLPANIYAMIENKIIRKLMDSRRFQVYECLECKTTQVMLKEDSFSVLRLLESNQRLQHVGRDIGVNGILMWNAFVESGKVVLQMRLVDVNSGRIMWSQQYLKKSSLQFDPQLYVGLWGLPYSRNGIAGNANVSGGGVLNMGALWVQRSAFSENVDYGAGFDVFANTAQTEAVNVQALGVNGRMMVALDSLWGKANKQTSLFNAYLSMGISLVKSEVLPVVRGGLTLRFNHHNYIDLGMVMIPETLFQFPSNPVLVDEGRFGGASYDISMGYRF
jgi:hypothetical protein